METARAQFNSITEFDEMLSSEGGSLAVFERLAMQADLIEGLKFMFKEVGDLVNDIGDALWDAGVVCFQIFISDYYLICYKMVEACKALLTILFLSFSPCYFEGRC